ncbi:MAG: hypothetical protein IKV97_00060 [Clostridia bacterium]|nr:hypothetical protein [Clostridia bacterium]
MDTVKFNKFNTKITAHRGLSGLETENTAAAFIAAGQRSYFGIETDIHKTADGVFVCCHDSDIERVSGKSMIIEQATWEELSAVLLRERGTEEEKGYLRIPLLTDYISICKKYGKVCVAEIKGLMELEDLEKIINAFEMAGYLDKTIFIAFDFENLVRIRTLRPTQSVQYLTGKFSDELVDLLVKHKMDLDIHYGALTAENIKLLRENGITVNCWTVDNPADGERLAAWGVDHITSNIME